MNVGAVPDLGPASGLRPQAGMREARGCDFHCSHPETPRVIQEVRKALRQAQGNALGIGPSGAEQFPAQGGARANSVCL